MIKEIIYKIKRVYHFFKTGLVCGLVSQIKYRFPNRQLKIVAITGTDGKTSSSSLLYHVLKTSQVKTALLSTVAAYLEDKQVETGLHVTSPNPKDLYFLLAKMVSQKIEVLVLEYTSHGAYQHRLWGIKPLIAGVTNVNHEHLDYHLNYQNYLDAKASLLKQSPVVILNEDDASYLKLRHHLKPKKQLIEKYSSQDKLPKILREAVQTRFPASFNQMNARLVIKIAQMLKIPDEKIASAISSFPGVPGRMQDIKVNRPFKVVVDFAHTPQGLASALTALQQRMKKQGLDGKLIAVYGCAGLRDRAKRPLMGKIGIELADMVIFTAEDPRTENVWSIIRQMKEQLESGHDKIITIADRHEAIEYALTKLAKKGDLVAILGKGPEKSMCYGTTEMEWSDEGVVKEVLK